MKKTGATLIWGTVTPVWPGAPGKLNADEDAFNQVAEKAMNENGGIINDLNAEVRRQGLPKGTNVQEVGNLPPLVTRTIENALAARKRNTKPLPRVLMIGDSITGTYLGGVTKNLDGKAAYGKNLANLIRDRKAPDMPVVVAAAACDDGKIHAAQMGVGNAAKYPEFSGNLKSMDTKPFFRAANLSPGGYATVYHNNAESFLEIGEAMGKAMLELQQK